MMHALVQMKSPTNLYVKLQLNLSDEEQEDKMDTSKPPAALLQPLKEDIL